MKIRFILFHILVFAVSITGLYLLQTSLFNYLELAGVVPNLLLAYTSMSGFSKGRRTGMLVGLFSGFVLDFFSGQLFGLYALLYLLIGYTNGLFRTLYFGDDVKLPMLFVGISDLLAGGFIYLFAFAMNGKTDFYFYLMNIMIPEAVYTVVLSIFMFLAMTNIDQAIHEYEHKKERRLG